jgi:hypothetical protein
MARTLTRMLVISLVAACSSDTSRTSTDCSAGQRQDGNGCRDLCLSDADCTEVNEICDTTGICEPTVCGDGLIRGEEECDAATANAESAACTPLCKIAVCGDGFVWIGMEACDQGPLNGTAEGTCSINCDSVCRGPNCTETTRRDEGGFSIGAENQTSSRFSVRARVTLGLSPPPTTMKSDSFSVQMTQQVFGQ